MNHSDAFSSDSPVFFRYRPEKLAASVRLKAWPSGKSRKYQISLGFFLKANAF